MPSRATLSPSSAVRLRAGARRVLALARVERPFAVLFRVAELFRLDALFRADPFFAEPRLLLLLFFPAARLADFLVAAISSSRVGY
jgi:hypothetical protein